MPRSQQSRQAAADRRSPPPSAAAASGAGSGPALGGVQFAQADPETGSMAEQLAAAPQGAPQPDELSREGAMEALCMRLANAADAGTAVDALRDCLAKACDDIRDIQQLIDCGAAKTALACMQRFRGSEDVQRAALEYLNQLRFSAGGWDHLLQMLHREGVEPVAADLIAAAHTIPGDTGLALLAHFIELMPELGPIAACDAPLLHKALAQLAAGSGGEDPSRPVAGVLRLLAALMRCPDDSPLDAVAALPGLVPVLLTILHKAHATGRRDDVFWALDVLTAGSGFGDSRLGEAVGAVAVDATLKLVLRLASDADDGVAMNASALCYQSNVYNSSDSCPSPLTGCSNAVPALLAAIRATGPMSPPTMQRDKAWFFAVSALDGVLSDLGATVRATGSVARLLTATAPDVIERLAHVWEAFGLSAFPAAVPMLGFIIEACVASALPGQLTAAPRAMAAAARAVTDSIPRGEDTATKARSVLPTYLLSVAQYAPRLTSALHAARGSPWTRRSWKTCGRRCGRCSAPWKRAGGGAGSCRARRSG